MEATTDTWSPPSERVAELIRDFARATLQDTDPIFDAVDRAVLEAAPERIVEEPALAHAFREANHANLTHWMAANVAAPGARVPANVGPQTLELARDIVRRGFDDTSLNSYRVGQNAALRFLVDRVFEISDELEVIRELLDVTSRSVFAFVDDTLAAIEEQIGLERDQLERGTHAERLATVNLILEGAPISVERASSRLGYELAADHRAAVVWTEGAAAAGALERTADRLARAAGAARPFTVVASSRSLWVWVSPGTAGSDSRAASAAAADRPGEGAAGGGAEDRPAAADLPPGVNVALGSIGRGLDGFRRSHFGALATQRIMQRARHEVRIAAYPEIELVAVAAADEQRATDFARRTLGELLDADPVLRATLLAYVRADYNTSAAARALFAHRNTVLNRLDRARELLPAAPEGRGLELGLALEIVRWLGVPGAAAGSAA